MSAGRTCSSRSGTSRRRRFSRSAELAHQEAPAARASAKEPVKQSLTAETAETAEMTTSRILGVLCVLCGKTAHFFTLSKNARCQMTHRIFAALTAVLSVLVLAPQP